MSNPGYVRVGEGGYVRAGTGYFVSTKPEDPNESFSAGQNAAQMAIDFMKRKYSLEGVDPNDLTLTIVFSSTRYKLKRMLKGVRAITGDCPLIGCTTAGEVTTQGVHDDSVSAFILSSDLIAAGTGVGKRVEEDAKRAGMTAASGALKRLKMNIRESFILRASQLMEPEEMIRFSPYSVIMLPPGLAIAEDEVLFYTHDTLLIEGLREKVGFTPIIGGSSGDGMEAGMSYQFCNDRVYEKSVVCAILTNFVKTGFSTELPFIPTEKTTVVTKLNDSYPPFYSPFGIKRGFVVKELDDIPAARKYFELLQSRIREPDFGEWLNRIGDKLIPTLFEEDGRPIPERDYSLGLTDLNGKMWARVPAFIREDESIEFSSPIPEKAILTLMEIPKDFTISPIFKTDLESNKLSEGLRKAFEDNGCSLSSEVEISMVDRNEWMIKDGEKEYTIREYDNQLNIYDKKTLLCENTKKAVENAIRNAGISSKEDIAAVILFICCIHRCMASGIGRSQFNTIKEIVGEDTPIIGFYTYGEQMSTLFADPSHIEQSATVMIISKSSPIRDEVINWRRSE